MTPLSPCMLADNVVRHYKLSRVFGFRHIMVKDTAVQRRRFSVALGQRRNPSRRAKIERRIQSKPEVEACTLKRDQRTGSSHNKRVGIPFQTILPNLQSVLARAKRRQTHLVWKQSDMVLQSSRTTH